MMHILDSPIMKAIHERRSVRHFMDTPVSRDLIMTAIEAASWAPSGLNNQPWRFAIIWDQAMKEALAALTKYSNTLKSASVLIAGFLDKEASYDYTKDCQAIGACLQNLLLSLHSMDLGAVWIGEILKNKERVTEILGLPERARTYGRRGCGASCEPEPEVKPASDSRADYAGKVGLELGIRDTREVSWVCRYLLSIPPYNIHSS